MDLNPGSSLSILRKWVVNERDIWVRVELVKNLLIEHPNTTTKGWIRIQSLDLDSVIYLFLGSTFGLLLRLLIKYNFNAKESIYFNHLLIVNLFSSLLLGLFIPLSLTNQNLFLFFSVGFLGCFSTFSSFIYQLFVLIQKRKYISFFIYYMEVFLLSFLFFSFGYLLTLRVKS